MCGIAGLVGDNIASSEIYKLLSFLEHRGPDATVAVSLNDCQLGMTRLAIVDVAEQHQPYFNEDKNIVCVFNGEIYNHGILRKQLEKKKHKLKNNQSDGEVIAHLYEEYGLDYAKHLEGIFAIAIYDVKNNKILLTRDQFGIKPLYYAMRHRQLIFSSEIAPLKNVLQSLQPNLNQIRNFMLDGNTFAPDTIYTEIQQIMPGTNSIFNIANLSVSHVKYYQPSFNLRNFNINFNNEIEVAEKLLDLLKASVKSQTMSDVGYGALLSGGIDSSAIAVLASQFSEKSLKTYCAYYPEINDEGKMQDLKYAKQISRIIGSQHHEIPITYSNFINNFENIYTAFDEPYAGVVTNFFVSEEISKSNKVALTGDGSDEIFGSYLTHRVAAVAENFRKTRKISQEDIDFIGLKENQINTILKYQDAKYLHSNVRKIAQTDIIEKYLNKSLSNLEWDKEIELPKLDLLNQVLSIETRDLLPNQILPFVDRLSMRHSVELRPPFLDINLVDFAFAIPGNLKIKNHTNKYILKSALTSVLPKEIIDRKKEGFILPLHKWMNGDLKNWIKIRLNEKNIQNNPFLNYSELQILLKQDNFDIKSTNLIWKTLILNEWWFRFNEDHE